LRARRERPRRCSAAKKGYEIAPLHSITSSARASSVGGTSRLSIPSSALVDGRHGGAEMDRGTLSAALGYEKFDERAISPRDSPLPTESMAHPFVAQGEGADAVRVGRVKTLDHSFDYLAQLTVLAIAKMRLQEFGNRRSISKSVKAW
jgi:hypothetical protein